MSIVRHLKGGGNEAVEVCEERVPAMLACASATSLLSYRLIRSMARSVISKALPLCFFPIVDSQKYLRVFGPAGSLPDPCCPLGRRVPYLLIACRPLTIPPEGAKAALLAKFLLIVRRALRSGSLSVPRQSKL